MPMHPDDVRRELSKIAVALEGAEARLARENESNAALHMSDRVLYSPLTVAVINARKSLARVREYVEQTTKLEETDR